MSLAKPLVQVAVGVLALASIIWLAAAAPVGTSFHYQGSLSSGGAASNAPADLRFRLYDAPIGGNQVGPVVDRPATAVAQGSFNVDLDFGSAAGSASARWLEIDARSPAGSGSYVTLTPRQRLSPAPVAIRAADAPGSAHAFVEFSTPGSVQFVIPADITRITVELWGAGGGTAVGNFATIGSPTPGGAGGYSRTVLAVTPGEIYILDLGAPGAAGDAVNGGPGQAGGFTQIRLNGSATPLLLSGGGSGGIIWDSFAQPSPPVIAGGSSDPAAMVGRTGKPATMIGGAFPAQVPAVATHGSVEPIGSQGGWRGEGDGITPGVIYPAGAGFALITY